MTEWMMMINAIVAWLVELVHWLTRLIWLSLGNKHHTIARKDWQDFLWWISFRQLPRRRRRQSDRVVALRSRKGRI
ncbi:MAG: hypothetical protein HC925_00075 [Coleofasciculaceae cyanobacterium SM2_3_26]|nr:hypothetical protein [Coleofasciculaceae cyanobacterium SM2_3_26]